MYRGVTLGVNISALRPRSNLTQIKCQWEGAQNYSQFYCLRVRVSKLAMDFEDGTEFHDFAASSRPVPSQPLSFPEFDAQFSWNRRSTDQGREDALDIREGQASRPEFSLPQADGGKDAWMFLAACFVVEAVVWGELRHC